MRRSVRFALSSLVLSVITGPVALAQVKSATATTQPATRPTSVSAATKPAAVSTTTKPAAVAASTRPAPPANTKPVAGVKPLPEGVADLRALQSRVQAVLAKVSPAVVGLRVGGGQGSGVLISDDGYVLTAGHVSSAPGRDVVILLPSGRSVRAKALGINYDIDSGLVKIDVPNPEAKDGKWPFAELGTSAGLKRGDYCVVLGHPGGYKATRTAPLRLGRLVSVGGKFLRTDGTLVGGDSGGPLFDLDGRVIGIHSRIGMSLADNMHVPVDTYRETWPRLASGEAFGIAVTFLGGRVGGPYLGVQPAEGATDCRIGEVFANSPAVQAGLKAGDVITRFDRERVANFGELQLHLGKRKSGDEVSLEVLRDDKPVKLKVTIGKRPPAGN